MRLLNFWCDRIRWMSLRRQSLWWLHRLHALRRHHLLLLRLCHDLWLTVHRLLLHNRLPILLLLHWHWLSHRLPGWLRHWLPHWLSHRLSHWLLLIHWLHLLGIILLHLRIHLLLSWLLHRLAHHLLLRKWLLLVHRLWLRRTDLDTSWILHDTTGILHNLIVWRRRLVNRWLIHKDS